MLDCLAARYWLPLTCFLAVLALQPPLLLCAETLQVQADFSSDPKWECQNNVPSASACLTKTTDFGYSPTNRAGGTTFEGECQTTKTPMIPADGRPHTWVIHYVPSPKGQAGKVTVALDDATIAADVPPRLIAGDAALGRFGFLSWHCGGHYVEAYFDDLEYTAQRTGDAQ